MNREEMRKWKISTRKRNGKLKFMLERSKVMDFITFIDVSLTPKESNFIGQIGADLLIKNGVVPSNGTILHEIIYRAMLIRGTDVPKH